MSSTASFRIRPARHADADALCRFRTALWTDGSAAEHAAELRAYFASSDRSSLEDLVAEDQDGSLLGFCEVALRPFAEGCVTGPVGYLEGWYVVPGARRRGVGRALVEAAAAWSRERGCSELASDAAADNALSATAHAALGFAEVGLVRCFRKEL